jgi:hypothetical protein
MLLQPNPTLFTMAYSIPPESEVGNSYMLINNIKSIGNSLKIHLEDFALFLTEFIEKIH